MLSCPKFIHDGLSKKRKPPEVKVSLILETAMQPYCESFSTKQTHQVAVKTTKPMHKPAAASSFFGSLQEDTSFNGQKICYDRYSTHHVTFLPVCPAVICGHCTRSSQLQATSSFRLRYLSAWPSVHKLAAPNTPVQAWRLVHFVPKLWIAPLVFPCVYDLHSWTWTMIPYDYFLQDDKVRCAENGLKWWLTRSKLVGMLIWGSRNVKWDIAHVQTTFSIFSLDSPIQYSRPTISLAVLEISTNDSFWTRQCLFPASLRAWHGTHGERSCQYRWKLSSQYANLMTRSVGRPYHDLLQSAFSGNPPQVEASAAEIWSPGIFQSRQSPVIIVVWFLAIADISHTFHGLLQVWYAESSVPLTQCLLQMKNHAE